MKTRDRIIATALRYFNEDGYGVVTTAALAEACGIAEGNLWYHFKTKRDLLTAIADRFARRVEERLGMTPDPDDPVESYCRLLAVMMAEFRDYRFLYRDRASYGDHVEPIAINVASWLRRTVRSIEVHLAAMRTAGELDWPDGHLQSLASNATIILRFGLEYQAELGTGEGAVRRSLLQHVTLFEHALSPTTQRRVHAAIARIDETRLEGLMAH